jgi:hypothetical protein
MNSIEKAVKIIASSLRSTGDEIEVFSARPLDRGPATLSNEVPESISLVINYSYDIIVKKLDSIADPVFVKITFSSFQEFRDGLDELGLDFKEVMAALTLAVAANR